MKIIRNILNGNILISKTKNMILKYRIDNKEILLSFFYKIFKRRIEKVFFPLNLNKILITKFFNV